MDKDVLFKNILEDVLESSIVSFEDGVLRAEVQGEFLGDGVLEATVSKSGYRFICIVHAHRHTAFVFKLIHLESLLWPTRWRVDQLDCARLITYQIG